MQKCDLFVIGGGSGGVRAARLAAEIRRQRPSSPKTSSLAEPASMSDASPKNCSSMPPIFPKPCEDAPAFGWTKAQTRPAGLAPAARK